MYKSKQKNFCTVYYEPYGFSVGKFSYGYEQFFYKGVNLESIGAFCSIANNVTISGMNHPTEYVTTNPFIYFKSRGFIESDNVDLLDKSKNKKVKIGNDVWIGTGAIILPSVNIGNGAIIGTGAIVTKDVPAYAVVVGAPAKVVKFRFSEEIIEVLNLSDWWNWDNEKIKKNIELFTNTPNFIQYTKENVLVRDNKGQMEKYTLRAR